MGEKIKEDVLNSIGFTKEESINIGKRLKEKREKSLQISTKDFAARTKIAEPIVCHIENGEWDLLPKNTVGRRFIQLYANELKFKIPEFEQFEKPEENLKNFVSSSNLDSMVAYLKKKVEKRNRNKLTALASSIFQSKRKDTAENSTTPKKNPPPQSVKSDSKTPKTLAKTRETIKKIKVSAKGGSKKSGLKWVLSGGFATLVVGAALFSMKTINDHSNDIVLDSTVDSVSNNDPLIGAESVDDQNYKNLNEPKTEVQDTESTKKLTTDTLTSEENIAEADISGKNSIETPVIQSKKLKIKIVSPVKIKFLADGKMLFEGLSQTNSIDTEIQEKALLVIQDSSKVTLSFAGWENELLSPVKRKRTILLNANPFEDMQ